MDSGRSHRTFIWTWNSNRLSHRRFNHSNRSEPGTQEIQTSYFHIDIGGHGCFDVERKEPERSFTTLAAVFPGDARASRSVNRENGMENLVFRMADTRTHDNDNLDADIHSGRLFILNQMAIPSTIK